MKPAELTSGLSKTSVIIVIILLTGVAFAGGTEKTPPPYTVKCKETGGKTVCKVDKKTYIGWRTYHSTCYVCHAQDAVGSSFAPSLVERLKVIDKKRFMDVVANGFTGQIGVMPGWKDNPNVNNKYDALYSYLKARSDGVLPPGRPKKLP